MTENCYTKKFFLILIFLVTPIIALVSVIIPLILYKKTQKQRIIKKRFKIIFYSFTVKYGMLNLEYKDNSHFFELAKLLLKTFILLIINQLIIYQIF